MGIPRYSVYKLLTERVYSDESQNPQLNSLVNQLDRSVKRIAFYIYTISI